MDLKPFVMLDETFNKVGQEQGKETRKDPTSKQLVEMIRSGLAVVDVDIIVMTSTVLFL